MSSKNSPSNSCFLTQVGLAFAFFVCLLTHLRAETFTFDGSADTDFLNLANWTGDAGGTPTPANMAAGDTYALNANATLSGATQLNGDMSIPNGVTLTITDTGTFTIAGQGMVGQLLADDDNEIYTVTTKTGTISNFGTFTLRNDGIEQDATGLAVGTFVNQTGATFTRTGNQYSAISAHYVNHGIFTEEPGASGAFWISPTFTNSLGATADLRGAAIRSFGLTNRGMCTTHAALGYTGVEETITINNFGTLDLSSAGTKNGSSLTNQAGGVINLGGGSAISLDNMGVLNLLGNLTLTDDSGVNRNRAGATLNQGDSSVHIGGNIAVINEGVWTGSGGLNFGPTGSLTIEATGVLTNDGPWTYNPGSAANRAITVRGTLTGATPLTVPATATLVLDGGSIPGDVTANGPVSVVSDTTLDAPFVLNGDISIPNGVTLTVAETGSFLQANGSEVGRIDYDDNGGFDNNWTVVAATGTIRNFGSYTVKSLGTALDPTTLSVANFYNEAGATFLRTGGLFSALQGNFRNSGSFLEDPSVATGEVVWISPTFTNTATGVFELYSDAMVSFTLYNSGVGTVHEGLQYHELVTIGVNNSGTLNLSSHGTRDSYLRNQAGGTVNFSGRQFANLDNFGTFNILGNASAIGSGGTVSRNRPGGVVNQGDSRVDIGSNITVINEGLWTGSGGLNFGPTGSLTIEATGVLTNDGPWTYNPGSAANRAITVRGTLTGATPLTVPATATLILDGGSIPGDVTANGPVSVVSDTGFGKTMTLANGASFTIEAGVEFTVGGSAARMVFEDNTTLVTKTGSLLRSNGTWGFTGNGTGMDFTIGGRVDSNSPWRFPANINLTFDGAVLDVGISTGTTLAVLADSVVNKDLSLGDTIVTGSGALRVQQQYGLIRVLVSSSVSCPIILDKSGIALEVANDRTLTTTAPITHLGGDIDLDGIWNTGGHSLTVSEGSSFSGAGTLQGPLRIEGTLRPDVAGLTITGALSYGTTATTEIVVNGLGTGEYSQITTVGMTTLSGNLNVNFSGKPAADVGHYQFITGATQFSFLNPTPIGLLPTRDFQYGSSGAGGTFTVTTLEGDENFEGPNIPDSLEQTTLGTPATYSGTATFSGAGIGDRSYVRTKVANYNEHDFVAEITVTLNGGGEAGSAYFGIGRGDRSNVNSEPTFGRHLFVRLQPSDFGDGAITLFDFLSPSAPLSFTAGDGTHRLRLFHDHDAGTVTIGIDRNYLGGVFQIDDLSDPISISDNLLLTGQSRIFFGGAGGVDFDDLSIRALHRWTGAVSFDWSTPGNWTYGFVPDDGADVIFPEAAFNKAILLNGQRDITSITVTGTGYGFGSELGTNDFLAVRSGLAELREDVLWRNVLNGSGGLRKFGDGTMSTNKIHTYTGPTVIREGLVTVEGINPLPVASPLTISTGAELFLNDLAKQTVGSLSGEGALRFSGQANSFAIGTDNTDAEFTGLIESEQPDTTLSKVGTGTQTVTSSVADFSEITIDEGTLCLDADTTLGHGPVTISNTGTLKVTSARTVTLTASQSLLLEPGASLEVVEGGTLENFGAITLEGNLEEEQPTIFLAAIDTSPVIGFINRQGGTFTRRKGLGNHMEVGGYIRNEGIWTDAEDLVAPAWWTEMKFENSPTGTAIVRGNQKVENDITWDNSGTMTAYLPVAKGAGGSSKDATMSNHGTLNLPNGSTFDEPGSLSNGLTGVINAEGVLGDLKNLGTVNLTGATRFRMKTGFSSSGLVNQGPHEVTFEAVPGSNEYRFSGSWSGSGSIHVVNSSRIRTTGIFNHTADWFFVGDGSGVEIALGGAFTSGTLPIPATTDLTLTGGTINAELRTAGPISLAADTTIAGAMTLQNTSLAGDLNASLLVTGILKVEGDGVSSVIPRVIFNHQGSPVLQVDSTATFKNFGPVEFLAGTALIDGIWDYDFTLPLNLPSSAAPLPLQCILSGVGHIESTQTINIGGQFHPGPANGTGSFSFSAPVSFLPTSSITIDVLGQNAGEFDTIVGTGSTLSLGTTNIAVDFTRRPLADAGDYLFLNNWSSSTGTPVVTPVGLHSNRTFHHSGGILGLFSVSLFGNPYDDWASETGLQVGVNAGFIDDPNQDGKPNILHFAENTNPLGPGGHEGKRRCRFELINGNNHLVLTTPVRTGATFSGTTSLISSPVDGIAYHIEGDEDLQAPWDLVVTEVTPLTLSEALASDMPPLGDIDGDGTPDWEYRSFMILESEDNIENAFLRTGVSTDP